VATKSVITLKGSAAIVTEFFDFSISSLLYQRGIYPPDVFSSVPKYGLSLFKTTDKGLLTYLDGVLRQLNDWLLTGQVQKLVVVITGAETGAVLERWVFNVETDKEVVVGEGYVRRESVCLVDNSHSQSLHPLSVVREKSEKELKGEIQALMRYA
jgi:mitotic spindle assembly checkpoint protein MAD2